MADNNLNTQLQAIHARLDRVDDDLIANYAGVSQLVAGLAANPVTSGSVAASLRTYNFSSVGQTMLKKLMGMVPGYNTFKSLQHLDAAGLLGNLTGSLAAQASAMAASVAGRLQSAVEEQVSALADQATALADQANALADQLDKAQALQNAIDSGADAAQIAVLQAAKNQADNAVNAANNVLGQANALVLEKNSAVDQVNQASNAVNGFIDTLTGIASGKTVSAIIK